MKKLERILAAFGFIVGISLIGYGLYRDENVPEKNQINSVAKGAGLAFFSLGAGLTFKGLVDYEDKRYSEESKKFNYKD